jgi:hypothetical protein
MLIRRVRDTPSPAPVSRSPGSVIKPHAVGSAFATSVTFYQRA